MHTLHLSFHDRSKEEVNRDGQDRQDEQDEKRVNG
jgi:hypothetical protein